MDWVEILLPFACAFAVGIISDAWWGVLVTFLVGVVGYGYAVYATDDATLGAAVPLLIQWTLVAVAGVVVRRGVRQVMAARREGTDPQQA